MGVAVGQQRLQLGSCSRALRTASCALVRFSKWSINVLTEPAASNGSSICVRTKSLRLPTDFIDTVWWNSSMACSDSMPSLRRKSLL